MPETASQFRTMEIGDFPCPGGTLKHVTVKSHALRSRSDCSVYAPAQVAATRNAPVVILLHGVYGSHWVWNSLGQAHTTLQALIDTGQIQPMILATPSDGLWGDGSGYFAHNGRDYEEWIAGEVPRLVHEVTGNAPDAPLYLAGLSMGGYGALRIGANRPARFKALTGHSSITVFEEMAHFVEEPLESYDVANTESLAVITAMQTNKGTLPPFQFDCGTEDDLIEGNRRLHTQLEDAGIPHRYTEYPGGHEWPYWAEHIRETFLFFENIRASSQEA